MKDNHPGGIYVIKNIINGKIYVGSSRKIQRRKKEHLVTLRKGVSCNRRLQNAFKKYGENAFEFSVLEVVEDFAKLIEREDFWILSLDSLNKDKGYNIYLPSSMGNPTSLDLSRIKISEKIKRSFNIRPPGNLSRISKEEWTKNRLVDPNYSCTKYIKKTPPGQKQKRETSKPVLQYTKEGQFVKRWSSKSECPDGAVWETSDKRPKYLTGQDSIWILEGANIAISIPELLAKFDRRPKVTPKPVKIAEPYIILRAPDGTIHKPSSRREAAELTGITPSRIAQLQLGYKIKSGKRYPITQIKGWEKVL